jgi:tetratricopeptide (TPR) repeat protein
MKVIYIVISVFFLLMKGGAQDQKYIDSLITKLDSEMEDTSRINLLNTIANDLYYVNQEEIYAIAQQALSLSEDSDYKTGIAEAYYNLSIYFRLKGVYEPAINYAFQSLEIMEQTNNQHGVGTCYNQIGSIYYYLQNYKISLDYITKALKIATEQKDKKWIAGNNNYLGMVYEKLGEYDKALESYSEALIINEELNNKNWIASNYGNIGSLYQTMGNPKCLEYYFKRLNLKKELKDYAGISMSEYLIGKYYNSQHKFDNALPLLLRSKYLNDSIGSLLLASRISDELSMAYKGLLDFERAFHYHELNKKLDDSLNLEESTQNITRLGMQYQFKKDQELQNIQYQKTRILQILGGVGIIFLITSVILLINRQRAKASQHNLEQKKLVLENKLMHEELAFKDKLLHDNIDYLVTKNNLISSVSEKLVEQKHSFKKENQHLINEIILELKVSLDNDLWEEFELRFNQVHSDFYKNLNAKVPFLTVNEKKLCAFLRLNMSSKEIAAITKQRISSIETARTRLRKKLDISKTNLTLQEFLNQF